MPQPELNWTGHLDCFEGVNLKSCHDWAKCFASATNYLSTQWMESVWSGHLQHLPRVQDDGAYFLEPVPLEKAPDQTATGLREQDGVLTELIKAGCSLLHQTTHLIHQVWETMSGRSELSSHIPAFRFQGKVRETWASKPCSITQSSALFSVLSSHMWAHFNTTAGYSVFQTGFHPVLKYVSRTQTARYYGLYPL